MTSVNGRLEPRKFENARPPTHPKEVRVSELNNPRGVRQAVATGPRPKREWLTYAEAGEIVGLSRVTLWKLINESEIEAARVGRAVRINRESLTSYMRRSAGSPVDNA